MVARLFCDTIKQQPGVGSVHATSAIGNAEARRARRQRRIAVLDAEMRPKPKPDDDESAGDTGIGTEKNGTWSVPIQLLKAEPERQMIFGWASVVAKDGQYIIDKQGDIIPIEELENAVLDYMLHSRDHGVMHEAQGTGRLVMSFLTTPDYMNAFELTQKDGKIGWIAGWKIEDPVLWEAHKQGILPELSIGGSSHPFEALEGTNLDITQKARGRRLPRRPFRWS